MMETTSVSTLKVEPITCLACGKQIWVGVAGFGTLYTDMLKKWLDNEDRVPILHLDFIGGTLEQDDTGAFRPSARHQYTIHEHQPGER